MRTLQEWEQGRRNPGSAALTLLKVAERHADILQELTAAQPEKLTALPRRRWPLRRFDKVQPERNGKKTRKALCGAGFVEGFGLARTQVMTTSNPLHSWKHSTKCRKLPYCSYDAHADE